MTNPAEDTAAVLALDRKGWGVRIPWETVLHPPRETFVIGPLFPFGKSSVFYGPTGVGKSAQLAQVAVSFAAGAPSLWNLSLCPGGGPVLVYTAEDTLDDWGRKLAAIYVAGGVDVERAHQRLWIIDKTEGIARLSEVVTERAEEDDQDGKDGGRVSITRRKGRPTQDKTEIIAEAKRHGGPGLLILETASRLVEEEDNASFSILQSDCGHIARDTGWAVVITHHATKAATKDNDPDLAGARGGSAFVYNSRNGVALFPADPEVARSYESRFAADDVFTLHHTKATSSTRKLPPFTLIRTDGTHGAVFLLPDAVSLSPEQATHNTARLDAEREQEWDRLRRLYAVVEELLVIGTVSPTKLEGFLEKLQTSKAKLPGLVKTALDRGVLRVRTRDNRGITVALGNDPRRAVNGDPGPEDGAP